MQEQYLTKGIEIIKTLNKFTYQAYLIGGVVRDYLMNNEFVDIDIATNATPNQIQEIFPEVLMNYAHLGFVVLKTDGMTFEISTFREEEYKNTTRHPSKIYYAQNLIDDIKRRDFTVNALALTDNYKVVDLVKGVRDIKHKVVRTIGKPKVRFKEDPLRILRAINLVARFNFKIAFKTAWGIQITSKQLFSLSNYQISKEILKIFDAKYQKSALQYMNLLKVGKGLKHYGEGLPYIEKYYKKLSTIEKLVLCYTLANEIPENTCFDKTMLQKIQRLYQVVQKTKDYQQNEENITSKDIFNYGIELIISALKINQMIIPGYPKLFSKAKKLDKNLKIHNVSELKFSGKDVVDCNNGISGSYIQDIMDELVDEVISGMIRNEYSALKVRTMEILAALNPKEEPKNEKIEPINSTSELLVNFNMELSKLIKDALPSYLKGNETEEEKEIIKANVAKLSKEVLITKNSEYQKLVEEGLI